MQATYFYLSLSNYGRRHMNHTDQLSSAILLSCPFKIHPNFPITMICYKMGLVINFAYSCFIHHSCFSFMYSMWMSFSLNTKKKAFELIRFWQSFSFALRPQWTVHANHYLSSFLCIESASILFPCEAHNTTMAKKKCWNNSITGKKYNGHKREIYHFKQSIS